MQWTLSKLAEEFFKVIEITNAKNTVDNYKRYILGFIKSTRNKALSKLKPLDLLKWGKTWHRIQAVQRLFGWAVNEAEVIKKNPFKTVKKPRPGERRRVLSRHQVVNILRNTDRHFRQFLLCMRETIARPQEVRAFRWESLHTPTSDTKLVDALRHGSAFFSLEDYKGRERRKDPSKPCVILLTQRLGRLLARLASRRKKLQGEIFRNSKGKPWTSNAVRCRMRRLRKKLGLGPDYRGEQIVAYTFRHTQATEAAARGIRDRILAELMGHTSTRTTARYQHLDTDHLREAFDKFNRKPKRKPKLTDGQPENP